MKKDIAATTRRGIPRPVLSMERHRSIGRIVYRHYLLISLTTLFAFNYMDRLALGLVQDNIKADLALSDAQLGFLSGIAFALCYSVMGIPIARCADRGNRVTIIALTTAVWSMAVALCGLAGSFGQLLLVRIGVGVGEAGCLPPAHSLIADYFSRAERPRAMGLYAQGANLSLVIGYFLAGWLNQYYGWRWMFVLLGLPGLAFAALSWVTFLEPRRATLSGSAGPSVATAISEMHIAAPTQPSQKQVIAMLWRNATFRHMLFAFAVLYFFGYGILQWQPAFFLRSFGLKTGEVGTWFACMYGLCGMVGTYVGAQWASGYAGNNEHLQLRAMAIVNVAFNGVVWALMYFSHNHYVAFVLMGVSTLGGATVNGPLFSTMQTIVPPNMRAMSIALVMLFANLIGMGLGPLAVGMLSDALDPLLGRESLRYSLLALCPGYLWASWHLWQASRSVTRDIAAV